MSLPSEPVCSIGLVNTAKCHEKHYTKKIGFKLLSSFSKSDIELILLRAGVENDTIFSDPNPTICYHHEKLYLLKFHSLQRTCCDPFTSHTSSIKGSLRAVDILTAKTLSQKTGKDIKPGQKLCPTCRKRVYFQQDLIPAQLCDEDSLESVPVEFVTEENREQLDHSFVALGCSPIKLHNVGQRDRYSYGKRKLSEIEEACTVKLAATLNVTPHKIKAPDFNDITLQCTGCSDLERLTIELKEKCHVSTRYEKLKILTLAPQSWTIEKVAREFDVTQYMVKQARKLKKESGVLADPMPARGKPLNQDILNTVGAFYEDDEFSRMCPGMKEKKSVKLPTGERIQKQKRLLLINLNEMYSEFKKRNPELKIGRTKFCSLRPEWCVSVNAAGSHSVCVCEIHQNFKLLTTALPGNHDYKDLMDHLVCSRDTRECMLHRCDTCPGKKSLEAYIEKIFNDAYFDEDDTITYKQWLHNDDTGHYAKLQDMSATCSDFVTSVSDGADKFTTHHFVAKRQAAFLREKKETLPPQSAIVLLDFAENYTFICQDAVQGYHWVNTQATLHPFTVYFRKESEEDLTCLNLCVISDDRDHVNETVHTFIGVMINHLKEVVPSLNYIYYFSDGAGGQYKNCKNFMNLCFHEQDFGMKAEWNFFATSHGKSPCDGIGGTVKRLVARASLQATETEQILSPADMYAWANQNIKGIKFFYVASADVRNHTAALEVRLSKTKTVPGTRSHHRFVPVNQDELQIYRLSEDSSSTKVSVSTMVMFTSNITSKDVFVGQYIAVVYDDKWYVGVIVEHSEEHSDVLVNFMARNLTTNSLHWPPHKDECYVPYNHILCAVPAPLSITTSGRQYSLDGEVLYNVQCLYDSYKTSQI